MAILNYRTALLLRNIFWLSLKSMYIHRSVFYVKISVLCVAKDRRFRTKCCHRTFRGISILKHKCESHSSKYVPNSPIYFNPTFQDTISIIIIFHVNSYNIFLNGSLKSSIWSQTTFSKCKSSDATHLYKTLTSFPIFSRKSSVPLRQLTCCGRCLPCSPIS